MIVQGDIYTSVDGLHIKLILERSSMVSTLEVELCMLFIEQLAGVQT